MSYLMGEMLIYLLGVAALGVVVGCLFTRSSYLRKVEDAEVVLLSQLHGVTKKLDMTQEQLDSSSKALEEERSRESASTLELEKLQSNLSLSQSKFDERKQQVMDLNLALEKANHQAHQAENKLEQQSQESRKMLRDFGSIKNRLSVFQSDLDDIVEQSGILRSAFERARLELVNKDKRIAELESGSVSSEGLQMAALSGTTEPELAISRIARLQSRVQELFDEVEQKDQEIENLKGSITIDKKHSNFINIAEMQADDLQQIGGLEQLFEEKLNEIGITRFRDIATWDDSDIERIDKMLDFEGSIKRENWVGQAQKLIKTVPSKPRQH